MQLDEKTLDALRMKKEVSISKTFKVIVKEFTTAEVFEFFSFEKVAPKDESLDSFREQIDQYLPKCLDGIDLDGLKQLPPSKLKEIWTAFKECNSVFFEVAQQMGLGSWVERLRSAFANDFGRMFAGSLKRVTASLPGTDTPSS
jgi:hypothetical protein